MATAISILTTPEDRNGDGNPANDDTDDGIVADMFDSDSDNDGIPDAVEFANALAGGDSDGDGIADWLDLDSDNETLSDLWEAGSNPRWLVDFDGLSGVG